MNQRILWAAEALIAKRPGLKSLPEFEALKKAVKEFNADQPSPDVMDRIVEAAQSLDVVSDGVCEVDDDAYASMGDDNGCYVSAWVWVKFDDMRGLNRDCPDCGHTHDKPITADWSCSRCNYTQKNWEGLETCVDCGEDFVPGGDNEGDRCAACADKKQAAIDAAKDAESPVPKHIKDFLLTLNARAQGGDDRLTPLFKRELKALVGNMEAE